MLTKRIIPCLDVTGGRVVKGVNFVGLRDAGDPVEIAIKYEEQQADEIVFLDITASSDARNTMLNIARRVAERVFMPFTIGGGIRTIDDIRETLLAGADKVSINTASVLNPNLIKSASDRFGSQCIVVAIDARANKISTQDSGDAQIVWEVVTFGGRKPTAIDALEWAERAVELGAGEILLTSMDADGSVNGYDIPLTRAVVERTNVPVIASGGAGNLEHIYEVLTIGKADAALAASIFHYGQHTVIEAKEYLLSKGTLVRPPLTWI